MIEKKPAIIGHCIPPISAWPMLLLPLALGVSCGLHAQTAPAQRAEQLRQLDQQTNISRERVPGTPLPPVPRLDLRILTPEKSIVPKAADELEFEVTRIAVEGATYFPRTVVDALFAPLLNRKIGLTALREAANRLENLYRERGIFLARVFIPPQQLQQGVFTIQVIEGHISQVLVEAPDAAMGGRVDTLAQQLLGVRPLDLASLERVLLLLNDLPGVAATAVLRPGAALGSSELLITVVPTGNLYLGTFNNTGSNTTGPYTLSYSATLQQPLGSPGQLTVSVTASGTAANDLSGIRSLVTRYAQAVGNHGAIISFGSVLSQSQPAGAVSSLNIQSDALSISPRLRYPLLRSRTSSLYLDTGLALNRSETTSAGTLLTSDRATVADLSVSWMLSGWGGGSQTLGLGVFKGLKWLGAMGEDTPLPSAAGFDPTFTKYTLNLQRTQGLSQPFSLRFHLSGQFTRDKLLASEQLPFGGTIIGRGFTPSAIVGDQGLGAILELRYDLSPYPAAAVSDAQLYLSVDRAATRTVPMLDNAGTRSHLRSTTLGMRFSVSKNVQLDLRLAKASRNIADEQRLDRRLLLETLVRF